MSPFRSLASDARRASAWLAAALLLAAVVMPAIAQTAHYAGVLTTLASNLASAAGVAVDSTNTLYILDAGSNSILKEVPGASGYTQTTLTNSTIVNGGLDGPIAVAVDTGGNLYVVNYYTNNLLKLTLNGSTYTSSVVSSSVGTPTGVAVTASGSALYVTSRLTDAIYQFAYASGSYIQQATVTSGISAPNAIAVDATGAWYVTDSGNLRRHGPGFSGAAFSGTVPVTGLGTSSPGLAVDAAGDIFVADYTNGRVVEEVRQPGNGTTYAPVSIYSGITPTGVAVDSNGVTLFTDAGRQAALALNPAALNFGSVAIGTTSAAQTLVFGFDTAGRLNATAPYQALLGGAGNLDYAVVAGEGTTCTQYVSFAVNSNCTVALTFTPKYPGPRNGAVVLNSSVGAQAGLGYVTGAGLGPQVAFAPAQVQIDSSLLYPTGVAVDGAGNVYVTDIYKGLVFKESYAGGTYSPTASMGVGLNDPRGVTVDGAGNVYIADSDNNHVVKEVYAGGIYTQSSTFIGSNLQEPSGVAVDGAGNVYIADTSNNRVLKEVYSNGTYVQSSATIGSNLNGPYAVAVDSSGNLYIADYFNHRVVKEVYAGGAYTQAATSIGSGLTNPSGVAVDAAGDVYISDANGNVVKETYANGTYTQSAPIGAGIAYPMNVAVDSTGNIFLTDGYNGRLLVEEVGTPPTLSFAGTPVFSTSADSPEAMVVSNTGNQALALSSVSSPTPNFSRDATVCLSGAVAAGGSCSIAYSYTPQSTGSHGALSNVADNSLNVAGQQVVQLQGAAATRAAQTITFPQPAVSGNFVAGTVIALNATSSSGLAVNYSVAAPGVNFSINGSSLTLTSGSGTVAITASQNGNSSYNAATNVTDSFTANIVAAPPAGASLADTAIGATSTAQVSVQIVAAGTLGSVQGLTQGAPGLDYSASVTSGSCAIGSALSVGQICTLTVAFTPQNAGPRYGAVQVLDGSGNILGTTFLQANGLGPQVAFAPTQLALGNSLNQPTTIVADAAGNVYIVDAGHNRVVKEVYAGGTYTQSSTPIGSGLNQPYGVAVDGAGNLYISDFLNNRIVKEVYAGGTYTQSSTPIGSGLSYPYGVAVDGAGNVFIADTTHNRVVKEVYAGGTYTQASLSIGSGFNFPSSVSVDGAGNLYINDYGNLRVVKEVYAGGTYTQSSTGIGTGLFSALGAAVDGSGNVYIADTGNNRALVETVLTPPTLSFPSTATGITSAPLPTAVTNLGNQPLIFPVPTSGTDPRTGTAFALETNADTTCPVVQASGTAGQIAANATCLLSYVFTPNQVGTFSSSSILTDNTLNVSGSMQSFVLTGVGTQGTQTAQTINFPQPAAVYPGTAALSATASSGLPVSYTLVSGPATLFGSTLTYTGPGTVVVTANQGGNVQYAAAPPVSISITVTQAIALLNWQPSTLKIYTGTPLDTGILDATESIPATISYSSYMMPSGAPSSVAAGTVLNQGNYGLTATFTPQDALRYGIVSDTLLFTVQNMNVFVANSVGSVTSLYNNGTTIPSYNNGSAKPAAVSGGGIGAAVDNAGYVWSIDAGGGGVSKFDDVGALVASYSGVGGISAATALAVDGSGTVWVANKSGTVSALSNGGVAAAVPIGSAANLSSPASITVDPAGSLWIANSGNNTVTEIIGVAVPVTTPLAQSVVNNTVAAKP